MLEELITLEVPLPSARSQRRAPALRRSAPGGLSSLFKAGWGDCRESSQAPPTRGENDNSAHPQSWDIPRVGAPCPACPRLPPTRVHTKPRLAALHCHSPGNMPPLPRNFPGADPGRLFPLSGASAGPRVMPSPGGVCLHASPGTGAAGDGPPPARRCPGAGKAALPVSSPRTSWKRRGVGA